MMTLKQALGLAAPHTFPASVCPALFGILFCRLQGLRLGFPRECALLLACVFFQSAVNTLNDYFDFVKGADSVSDNVEASDAVLVYGDLDPHSARNLGIAFIVIGAVLGLLSARGSGFLPIGIGCIGAMAIFLYSGGPFPLSYLPVGEAVSGFVMGGLIPLGISACADGKAHWEILPPCLPLILGISLIMMSNNGCDIEKDRQAGRHTLPALLGRGRTVCLYRGLSALWLLSLCLLPPWLLGLPGLLSPALLFLFGRGAFRTLFKTRLLPEGRICQMKGITKANLFWNGAYIAACLFAYILLRITKV